MVSSFDTRQRQHSHKIPRFPSDKMQYDYKTDIGCVNAGRLYVCMDKFRRTIVAIIGGQLWTLNAGQNLEYNICRTILYCRTIFCCNICRTIVCCGTKFVAGQKVMQPLKWLTNLRVYSKAYLKVGRFFFINI